jgi:hypothetical protein
MVGCLYHFSSSSQADLGPLVPTDGSPLLQPWPPASSPHWPYHRPSSATESAGLQHPPIADTSVAEIMGEDKTIFKFRPGTRHPFNGVPIEKRSSPNRTANQTEPEGRNTERCCLLLLAESASCARITLDRVTDPSYNNVRELLQRSTSIPREISSPRTRASSCRNCGGDLRHAERSVHGTWQAQGRSNAHSRQSRRGGRR